MNRDESSLGQRPRWNHRPGRSGSVRVVALALVVSGALAVATSTAASAPPRPASSRDCFSRTGPALPTPDAVLRMCTAGTHDADAVRAGTASLHVGAAFLGLGRTADALRVLSDAITYLHGRDAGLAGRALLLRGQAHRANGADSEAIRDFTETLDLLQGGDLVGARLALADAYRARGDGGDLESAEALYVSVVTLTTDGSFPSRRERLLAYLGLGHLARDRQDWPVAVESFRRAVNEDPDHYGGQLGLGAAALHLQDAATAEVAFQQAYALARSEPAPLGVPPDAASQAASGVAAALGLQGDRDVERVAYLERAAVEAPLEEPSYLVAYADELAWGARQDLEEAERWYAEASERAGGRDAEIWLKLARVQLRRNETDASTASVQRARAIAPDAPDVVLFDGQLSFSLGRWREAAGAFWSAKGFDHPAVRAEARYYISRIFTEGDLDLAAIDELGIDRRRYTVADLAIGFADEAVKQSTDDGRYRAQACLARVKYLSAGAANEALAACERVGATAEGQLLRGMAHLRAATFRPSRRVEELDVAYQAFDLGLASADAEPLQRRLRYGMGLALQCAGLEGAASVHLAGVPSERRWFQSYGATCTQGRPVDDDADNG
jgi:tetratricopeptide (TPR) repeat protein